MTPPGSGAFLRAVRAELDTVLSAHGLAYESESVDARGAELVYAGRDTEVVVRWDATEDDVTVWVGGTEADLPTLTERLRQLGEDDTADRLLRVAAPGCETGVRVAEHAAVLRRFGDALFGR